ncbi:MAG: TIGR03086 family metal-binding protein [Marmoricola sp.]
MPATKIRSVALLERAIGYTRAALALVDDSLLDEPTPCDRWDLRTLLEHMDEAFAAFTEAGELGTVDLRPLANRPEADRLVESLRLRACSALGGWTRHYGDERVLIGTASLDAGALAAIGALEIAVHGWDVGQACGADLPLPPKLAESLLDVAADIIGDADRPIRFARPRETDASDPGERLLAFLGR